MEVRNPTKLHPTFGSKKVQLPRSYLKAQSPDMSPAIPGTPSSNRHVKLKPSLVCGAYDAGIALSQFAGRAMACIFRHAPVSLTVPGPKTPTSSSAVKLTSAVRPLLYDPAAQSVHAAEPSGALVPAGHGDGVVVFAEQA